MTQHTNALWSKEADKKAPRSTLRPVGGLFSDLSSRKILRLAIVLTMSFLCWLGIGCFALEMVQLAAR
jgi:hypothetical protein